MDTYTTSDKPIHVTEGELAERLHYMHQLGLSGKSIRRNRLLADMPQDGWKVLLNELLRERRGNREW